MKAKSGNLLEKICLILITLGIWVIILQNAGIIPSKQNVYVKGGYLYSTIDGEVEVTNTVDISGSVEIEDEVDVNIRKINGWNAANYYEYSIKGEEYHSLGTR